MTAISPWTRLRGWLFDGGDLDMPPARVQAVIRDQQDRSEILVGCVQLAAAALFATLYAVARMAEGQADHVTLASAIHFFWSMVGADPETGWIGPLHRLLDRIEFVFGALAIYALATFVRLGLALGRRLRPWMLYGSAAMDMALLMAVIWSFHLKYGQPAAFYLKTPTFVYVFIFVALRALRFEARYVLFAGAMGALGWAALVLVVLSGHGGPPEVTRSFVVYLTSNATLIGAEVDKIVAILVVTAILALAITRARRLLIRAAAGREAVQDLSRFLDPDIARRIRGAEMRVSSGEGELVDVAILTTDLRGFTKLANSLPPEEIVKLLRDYQGRVCPAIQNAGGSIDKFLGDGILSSFGAVRVNATHAADALRAADAVFAAVAAWNETRRAAGEEAVRVGLAIASGRVLFGAVGDGDRLEFTVIGDAVNLAAKLEKHTKTEAVRALADAATYDLALRQGYAPPFERERRIARAVAGVAVPVDLVVLEA